MTNDPASAHPLGPTRSVRTRVLDIGYYELGPVHGDPGLLLHGFPYDVHSYIDVAPLLAAAGLPVIVPYLRGHGPTRFLDPTTPGRGSRRHSAPTSSTSWTPSTSTGRSWPATTGADAPPAWWPRCGPNGAPDLCRVNSYLIQDIAAEQPIDPGLEAGFWYFFYFPPNVGGGPHANRREIAKVIWTPQLPCVGSSTTPHSIAPPTRSTTPTTSTSSSTPIATGSASPTATPPTRTSSSACCSAADRGPDHHARRPRRRQLPSHRRLLDACTSRVPSAPSGPDRQGTTCPRKRRPPSSQQSGTSPDARPIGRTSPEGGSSCSITRRRRRVAKHNGDRGCGRWHGALGP